MAQISIRAAAAGDLPELTELYNHYIRTTPFTFDIEPHTVETRRPWFDGFAARGRHRLFVAVRDGMVVGFASSQKFRPKAAYDTSVETSIYLVPGEGGRGVGTRLYEHLFEVLGGEDVHRAYAGIVPPNDPSERLHARFGFERVGVFREVGRKFGRYWDVGWWERAMP